jgi:hypothetical protein
VIDVVIAGDRCHAVICPCRHAQNLHHISHHVSHRENPPLFPRDGASLNKLLLHLQGLGALPA